MQQIRHLKKLLPEAPVLVLLRVGEPSIILILLQQSATGCLIEPFSSGELRACILQAVQGGTIVLSRGARDLLLDNCLRDDLSRNSPSLTRRERQLLHWLAGNLTYKQIADKIGVAPETIHRHASNLYKKYQAHSRDDVVKRHYGFIT